MNKISSAITTLKNYIFEETYIIAFKRCNDCKKFKAFKEFDSYNNLGKCNQCVFLNKYFPSFVKFKLMLKKFRLILKNCFYKKDEYLFEYHDDYKYCEYCKEHKKIKKFDSYNELGKCNQCNSWDKHLHFWIEFYSIFLPLCFVIMLMLDSK